MRVLSALLVAAAALSGCAEWRTDYVSRLDQDVASTLRVSSIDVEVPPTLTVSEARVPAPEADIVWQEPLTGNRYEQVESILAEAARDGTAGLKGSRNAELTIVVERFHALSEFARAWGEHSGVHNIIFTVQLLDAKSGTPLSEPIRVQSDVIAYSGAQSERAQLLGETQQKRITRHVAATIGGWIGTAPDNREEFWRVGY